MSKLYTEEQMYKFALRVRENMNDGKRLKREQILQEFTPIELPSDEEIENNAYSDRRVDDWEHEQQIGFERGAKWMRDKIQGGNNE